MWPRYATVLGWMTGAEEFMSASPRSVPSPQIRGFNRNITTFLFLFPFLRVINLKNCESLQRHYLKEVGGDKDPTIQHSCLHLLYLCGEKTLTEGRLAEMEQEFCHYQSTLTIQLGIKRAISDFVLSMLRENQTITDEGF